MIVDMIFANPLTEGFCLSIVSSVVWTFLPT